VPIVQPAVLVSTATDSAAGDKREIVFPRLLNPERHRRRCELKDLGAATALSQMSSSAMNLLLLTPQKKRGFVISIYTPGINDFSQ
jgi:hypothetical protein